MPPGKPSSGRAAPRSSPARARPRELARAKNTVKFVDTPHPFRTIRLFSTRSAAEENDMGSLTLVRDDARGVLTDRQQEILDFISASIRERGYPPTLREIGLHFGIKSTNGVNDHPVSYTHL